MAQVIGVVSGILTIFSFAQGLFPTVDRATNEFQFRVGLDGASPPEGGDPLAEAGGAKPDIRCFNEVGTYLNMKRNDGNKCNSGSEQCTSNVETDNFCAYTLFSANTDGEWATFRLCHSPIPLTWNSHLRWMDLRHHPCRSLLRQSHRRVGLVLRHPVRPRRRLVSFAPYPPRYDNENLHRSRRRNRYYSAVVLQKDDGGSERVKCAWLDADGDQRTTGIQIHWPEFNGGSDIMQDDTYYCANNPSMRFYTEPDPNSILPWAEGRNMFARDPSVAAPSSSSSPAGSAVEEGQRRAADDQYKRLRRQMAHDDRLVKSTLSEHAATTLCESAKSVGPDFVSLDEKKFCEMKSKTLYDFCEAAEEVVGGGGKCWDNEHNVLINKTAGVSGFGGDGERPLRIYGDVISWE